MTPDLAVVEVRDRRRHLRLTKQKIDREFPFAKYYNGGFEVFGNKEGTPRITAVIPAPDINHASDEDRQKTHDSGCNGVILQGYLITSRRLIRNAAFDGPGQKTTLKIIYRPCKNEAEIRQVASQINKILSEAVT